MKQITSKEIKEAVRAMCKTAPVYTPDRVYDCAEKSDLLGEPFWSWYRKFRDKLGVTVPATDVNDCDDMAAQFRMAVQAFNNRRLWKNVLKQMLGLAKQPNPIAIGELWYQNKVGAGHCLNIAFVGDNREIIYIEPQTHEQVYLSKYQTENIIFARF